MKFQLGTTVRLVGVIDSVTLFSEGVYYYCIRIEGGLPFTDASVTINEKAIRPCDKDDIDFFEARGIERNKDETHN